MHSAALAVVEKRLAGAGQRVAWRPEDVRAILRRYGVAGDGNAAPIMRAVTAAAPVVAAAPATAGGPRYTFTISTGAVDRMNDVIDPKGWRFADYLKNPVVLFSHDASSLPVGRSTRVWVEGDRLKAIVELATAHSAQAAMLKKMLDGGFVRAASVGFRPLTWRFSTDKARPGGVDFLTVELLEWSICTIPANGDCLIDPGQTGKALSPAAARRQRDLDLILLRAGR
jgi:HK97 family phage prohead protease